MFRLALGLALLSPAHAIDPKSQLFEQLSRPEITDLADSLRFGMMDSMVTGSEISPALGAALLAWKTHVDASAFVEMFLDRPEASSINAFAILSNWPRIKNELETRIWGPVKDFEQVVTALQPIAVVHPEGAIELLPHAIGSYVDRRKQNEGFSSPAFFYKLLALLEGVAETHGEAGAAFFETLFSQVFHPGTRVERGGLYAFFLDVRDHLSRGLSRQITRLGEKVDPVMSARARTALRTESQHRNKIRQLLLEEVSSYRLDHWPLECEPILAPQFR